MNIEGKIKMIGKTESFGSNGFEKREMVVTTSEQYPQHILVEFVQGKCELLEKLKLGDLVKVSLNLRGREWVNPQGETKYFNSVQGWKIDKVNVSQAQVASQAADNLNSEEPDDLPY